MRAIIALGILLALSGCVAWVPMALSAAGGAASLGNNVLGIDLRLRQLWQLEHGNVEAPR